jgi:hypothetical protein
MANRTVTNPIFIDTWTSDIVLANKDTPMTIRKIRLFSAAAGDIFALENAVGDQTLRLVQETNDRMVEVDFHDDGFKFSGGVTIDVSDCTGLGVGDYVWIYLK